MESPKKASQGRVPWKHLLIQPKAFETPRIKSGQLAACDNHGPLEKQYNKMHTCICFKKLAHMIMEAAGKFKIC